MFTAYTYEDWISEPYKPDLIAKIIQSYRSSRDFKNAILAQRYFQSDNAGIKNKYVVQLDVQTVRNEETGAEKPVSRKIKVAGTRISSSFLFRFITQENQHLLGNGVTLKGVDKQKLGFAFDTVLSSMGEKALIDGVCWGFWNNDHIEEIRAAADGLSGAVALVGEADSRPCVLIQFWRLNTKKPMYVRVFEMDGVTIYKTGEDGKLHEDQPKQPYQRTILRDAAGETEISSGNHPFLPVIPLYANPEHRSELTEAIQSKIDCFDRIASDFGDNLEMANDIYWVLNNFGGSERQVLETLAKIKELRAVANISDGTGAGSTAEPHTFEVPYEARKVALEILRRELYRDAMGLDIETLSGASLSTEAIETASKELNLKCDRFEWQAFDFVQKVLLLAGIKTEGISFKRQNITNTTQVIENIYRAAEDLDHRTRLKLNPMIPDDDIDAIMMAKAAEKTTGLATVEQLQAEIDRINQQEAANGTGQSRPVV